MSRPLSGLSSRARNLFRRSSGIDWEGEGLLDGAGGERERAERAQLLEDLARSGVPFEELRTAVAEDRLALLPVERVLAGTEQHTLADLAKASGVSEEELRPGLAAVGIPVGEPGEAAFDDDELAIAESIGTFTDAGLDPDAMLEVGQVLGLAAAQSAAAARELMVKSYLQAGTSERDLGVRVAEAAEALGPELERYVGLLVRVHLRNGVRRDVVGRTERRLGQLPETSDVCVAFADLVDFTALGERVPAGELGRVAGRLAAAATEVARPPVRLVKLVGDGVMLASQRPEPLLGATLELLEADLPPLRAGVARGPAVGRHGDLFGAPVNLANRLCELAEPGTALVDERIRDATRAESGVALRPAGRRRVKGVDRELTIFEAFRTRARA